MDFIAKSTSLVDALQKTVFQFVWNRKQDRISSPILISLVICVDVKHHVYLTSELRSSMQVEVAVLGSRP